MLQAFAVGEDLPSGYLSGGALRSYCVGEPRVCSVGWRRWSRPGGTACRSLMRAESWSTMPLDKRRLSLSRPVRSVFGRVVLKQRTVFFTPLPVRKPSARFKFGDEILRARKRKFTRVLGY